MHADGSCGSGKTRSADSAHAVQQAVRGLSLPAPLRQYFGRPAIRAQTLLDPGGMAWKELQRACSQDVMLTRHSKLFPVCHTWPMGFAWSSFVAQSVLLGCCVNAGLTLDKNLSEDHDLPHDLRNTFALATDDVMVYTVAPSSSTAPSNKSLRALTSPSPTELRCRLFLSLCRRSHQV